MADAVDRMAAKLFEFGRVYDVAKRSQVILAFGSHDEHIAHRAAQLYHKGYAPQILFTGGLGRITKNLWQSSEAAHFAEIAKSDGVPRDAIWCEEASTNTGENIAYSKNVLARLGQSTSDVLVVERPFRARRTKATLDAQWSELTYAIVSPELSYQDYATWYASGTAPISKHEFIALLVGDIERLRVYPRFGWQTPVAVPQDILDCAHDLAERGYTEQLIHGTNVW